MSIIKHVTLQTIVAHDFRYNPRIIVFTFFRGRLKIMAESYKRYNAGCITWAGELTTNVKQRTVKLSMLNNYAGTFWLHYKLRQNYSPLF